MPSLLHKSRPVARLDAREQLVIMNAVTCRGLHIILEKLIRTLGVVVQCSFRQLFSLL